MRKTRRGGVAPRAIVCRERESVCVCVCEREIANEWYSSLFSATTRAIFERL